MQVERKITTDSTLNGAGKMLKKDLREQYGSVLIESE